MPVSTLPTPVTVVVAVQPCLCTGSLNGTTISHATDIRTTAIGSDPSATVCGRGACGDSGLSDGAPEPTSDGWHATYRCNCGKEICTVQSIQTVQPVTMRLGTTSSPLVATPSPLRAAMVAVSGLMPFVPDGGPQGRLKTPVTMNILYKDR